jgi:hypothetical protein
MVIQLKLINYTDAMVSFSWLRAGHTAAVDDEYLGSVTYLIVAGSKGPNATNINNSETPKPRLAFSWPNNWPGTSLRLSGPCASAKLWWRYTTWAMCFDLRQPATDGT